MTDPKIFYRELDALLAKIRIEQAGANFTQHILTELESSFSNRLHFGEGRIYELTERTLHLIHANGHAEKNRFVAELAFDNEVVQLAYKNRSYIYDQPAHCRLFYQPTVADTDCQAAFWAYSPEQQWLYIFSLHNDWTREEITLFLNSVRMALNYRLFSDAIGTRWGQAVQIQKSLLPAENPAIAGYQIAGRSQPAEMVGGDFFDYYEFNEGSFGVAIGDASGHGLPSALLIRDVVTGLRMGLAMEFRTVHTVRRLNRVLQRNNYASNYVSLFLGEFEPDGHLFYVNAGHPGPLLVHDRQVDELSATGITLGFMEDIQLGRNYARMKANSVLVLYSDGIIERINNSGEMFGVDRLKQFLVDHQQSDAQAILELVYESVIEFGDGDAWEDDATLVVIKRSI